IDLDIAFIDPNHRVVAIHTMRVEEDFAGRVEYGSRVPAQFALEVPAGALARSGVQIGNKVQFEGNIPEPAKADPTP
ncbi:MAG: DUF192 domain-containing protein, partial [Planctomycetota bacterium]